MPSYDFHLPRIHVEPDLHADARVALDRSQSHYLLNVMRRGGREVLVFNGHDGEWRARVEETGRKSAELVVTDREREQTEPGDLHLLFAPLRKARLDYVVEKAVEMGASRIRPVVTDHVQNAHLRTDKLRINAREAAEQCGVLSIPPLDEPADLSDVLSDWDGERRLVFCDERSDGASPVDVLSALPSGPAALLVGPEGGFSPAERERLRSLPFVVVLPLGPRILRADTAAVAALALVQSTVGDWR